MMNWEAIGAIGETVGAFGVVASLVFVGVQLLRNTKTLRLNGTSEIVDQLSDRLDALAANKGIAEIMYKGYPDPNALEGLDYNRFTLAAQSLIFYFANVHFQFRSGAIDEEVWESISGQLTNLMNSPGMIDYWDKRGGNYPPEFRNFINNEVRGSGDTQWKIAGTE